MTEIQNLTPGNLDRAAVSVFTEGHCHSLALAIHRQTGWAMIGFFNYDDEDDPHRMRHVAIVDADGLILDAEGRLSLDILEARTGWESEPIADEATLIEWTTTSDENGIWSDIDPEGASAFVDTVLALGSYE